MNGDGISDIIIGAYYATYSGRMLSGAAFVVFGKTTGFSNISLWSLSSQDGFGIFGKVAYDRIGFSVSGAGDVNGDGKDDIIVGKAQTTNCGESYLIYGQSNPTNIDLNTPLPASSGFKIFCSDTPSASLGYSVSSIGDFNGDGLKDIIIGAPTSAPSQRTSAGRAYVIFGKSAGLADINVTSLTLSSSGGFIIQGRYNNDQLGYSVSGAGDINGDGLSDIIVGAPFANDGAGAYSGTVYVIYGKSSEIQDLDLNTTGLSNSEGFSIYGAAANDYFGFDVRSAGDVNGDGLGDLIAGADRADTLGKTNSGIAYVIYGSRSGTSNIALSNNLTDTQGFRILGPDASGGLAASVSSAGDLNGDGVNDLIIGSRSNSNSPPPGVVYVVFSNYTKRCSNSLEYYFPENNICDMRCAYPYQSLNPHICSLDLSPDEATRAKSTADVLNAGNDVTRITATVVSPLTAYQLWYFMFISSTQLLFYVRYIEIGFSPFLQKAFLGKKDPVVSLRSDSSGSIHQLPFNFKKYSIIPRFLVNFWQPILTYLIIGAILLLVRFVKPVAQKRKWLLSILEKVEATLKWNFLLMNFISYYHILVLYTSIEFRTLSLNSFLEVLSLIICVTMNLAALIVPFYLIRIIRIMRDSKRKITPEREKTIPEQEGLWKNYEVVFAPFKDAFLQQSFLSIYIAKTYLFTMVIAYLFDYPVAQGILLTIISFIMVLYLLITRPLKHIIVQIQYIVMELIYCLVSICALILACSDQSNSYAAETREALSGVILYSILAFIWAGQATLVIKALFDLKVYYDNRKRANQNAEKIKQVDVEEQTPSASEAMTSNLLSWSNLHLIFQSKF